MDIDFITYVSLALCLYFPPDIYGHGSFVDATETIGNLFEWPVGAQMVECTQEEQVVGAQIFDELLKKNAAQLWKASTILLRGPRVVAGLHRKCAVGIQDTRIAKIVCHM